ncbi:hypothetical protein FRB91_010311 [Serendipita sp. 411]|nr:hypothetical protein FRC15_001036 [Serendipita sp. 397]KAG8790458.1 hypothetical protein FRC16_000867 [Serendipita sp. 398]KAG8849018.1 hypothetical protein FRB91_010311 [Serendipita sp. 411]KAG8854772.1 hypothetical protein FRC20_000921 [Serendipita sp. 405]
MSPQGIRSRVTSNKTWPWPRCMDGVHGRGEGAMDEERGRLAKLVSVRSRLSYRIVDRISSKDTWILPITGPSSGYLLKVDRQERLIRYFVLVFDHCLARTTVNKAK